MSQKNSLKRHWLYVVTAIPFVMMALMGMEYGAGLYLYLVPAFLCFVQLVRPNKVIWYVLFLLYLGASFIYTYGFISEMIPMISGEKPDEPGPVLTLALILWAITIGLILIGPQSVKDFFKKIFLKTKTGKKRAGEPTHNQ